MTHFLLSRDLPLLAENLFLGYHNDSLGGSAEIPGVKSQ